MKPRTLRLLSRSTVPIARLRLIGGVLVVIIFVVTVVLAQAGCGGGASDQSDTSDALAPACQFGCNDSGLDGQEDAGTSDSATADGDAETCPGTGYTVTPSGTHASSTPSGGVLRQGTYYLGSTIKIPESVVRVVCYGATVAPIGGKGSFGSTEATFEFDSNSTNSLQILDGCDTDWGNGDSFIEPYSEALIVNNSPGTVVIKDCDGIGYSNTQDSWGGNVFMEDVGYAPMEFVNQTVYVRHLDIEPHGGEVTAQETTHVSVEGGQLWVVGYKQENPGAAFSVSNGADVEVLGGAIFVADPNGPNFPGPMIVNDGARMSVEGIATGIGRRR